MTSRGSAAGWTQAKQNKQTSGILAFRTAIQIDTLNFFSVANVARIIKVACKRGTQRKVLWTACVFKAATVSETFL